VGRGGGLHHDRRRGHVRLTGSVVEISY
jgi:hypothetical protein